MKLKLLTFAAVLLASFAAAMPGAQASTVGFAAIDRSHNDSYSNFALAFTNQVFSAGTLTKWSTYTGSSGQLALLVLTPQGGNNYQVAALDVQTVSAGLSTFSASISTLAGQILGVWMGTAKVDYTLLNQPSGPDQYTANLALGSAPTIGDLISFGAGSTDRQYSLSATVVPLPAALPLLASGFGLLGFLGWRGKRKPGAAI